MTPRILLAEHTHPTWADFGATEWICIVLAGAFTAWAVWKAVMYTLRPGEQEPDHIKRSILRDQTDLQVTLSSSVDGADDEVTAHV